MCGFFINHPLFCKLIAMIKTLLSFAAFSGFIAVGLGAFAAHGLKGKLEPALLSAFQTGVHYQMYHALALLGIAAFMQREKTPWLNRSAVCFMVGTVLFSGSLYALALGGPRWMGPITPAGGVAFLCGWLCLGAAAWHIKIR